MKSEALDGRECLSGVKGEQSLRVLMLYEDLPTGNRVMRLFDSVFHRFGSEVSFQKDMWKFDLLGCSSIGRIAGEDAVEADIILVSMQNAIPLLAEAKTWFETWMANRRQHPGAMVLLLNDDSSLGQLWEETQGFLEQMARNGGLDFFKVVVEGEDQELSIREAPASEEPPEPVVEWLSRKNAHSHDDPRPSAS